MAHWPDREPAALERSVRIERRSNLSPDECMCRYLRAGEGTPVVVTDAQEGWEARRLWTLKYLQNNFGSDALIANDRAPLRREDNPAMKTIRTTLGEFIDYMTTAGASSAIAAQERDSPFYGNSWSPFSTHATLRSHISRPYFVPDDIPPDAEELDRALTKVFLGPAGTVTRLHNDTYHTHAWLSQIRGTKQFILYPPSEAHKLHAGEGIAGDHGAQQTWFDPLRPEYDAFPRARHATPHVAICGPGDTILVPSEWFHYAVALTPSITLMRNFMNDANAEAFMSAWGAGQAADGPQRAASTERPMRRREPVPPPSLPPPAAGQQEPKWPLAHRTRSPLAVATSPRHVHALTIDQGRCIVRYPNHNGGRAPTSPAHPAANVEAVHTARGTAAARGIVVVDDRAAVPSNAANSSVPRGGSAEEGTGLADSLQGLCSRRVAVAWGWASTRR